MKRNILNGTGFLAVGGLLSAVPLHGTPASVMSFLSSAVVVEEAAYCPIADSQNRSYLIEVWLADPARFVQFNNVKMVNGSQASPSVQAEYTTNPAKPGTYDPSTDKFYRARAQFSGGPKIGAGCHTNWLGQTVYNTGSPFSWASNRADEIAGDEDPIPGDQVVPANEGWIGGGDYSPSNWETVADYCFVGRWYDTETFEIISSYVIYCVDQNGHMF